MADETKTEEQIAASERMKQYWADRREKAAEKEKADLAEKKAIESGEEAPKPVKKIQRAPWRPAQPLSIPEEMKDARFKYVWAAKDKIGNLPKKIQEGWELDKELQAKLEEKFGLNVLQTSASGLPDSFSRSHKIDSSALCGDLILMRMPIEMWDERQAYYFEQTRVRQKPSETLSKEARDLSTGEPVPTGAYGSYKEEFGRDT